MVRQLFNKRRPNLDEPIDDLDLELAKEAKDDVDLLKEKLLVATCSARKPVLLLDLEYVSAIQLKACLPHVFMYVKEINVVEVSLKYTFPLPHDTRYTYFLLRGFYIDRLCNIYSIA